MSLLSFLQFRSRRRAHQLYDEALELIDAGSYEDALAVGRKLRKVRYSGAFEIEGLAYQGLERPDDAVRVLREGVATAPGVWLNWSLLGNCLSDLGRYDEALDAYDRAEECAGVDHSLVNLKGEEALAYIMELVPPPAGADVKIDELLDMEPRPDGTKGAYDVSGRIFFEND